MTIVYETITNPYHLYVMSGFVTLLQLSIILNLNQPQACGGQQSYNRKNHVVLNIVDARFLYLAASAEGQAAILNANSASRFASNFPFSSPSAHPRESHTTYTKTPGYEANFKSK